MVDESTAGDEPRSGVPFAGAGVGERAGERDCPGGARVDGGAAERRRMGAVAGDAHGRLCDGAGALCAADGGEDGGQRPGLPQGNGVSIADTGGRRILARQYPVHLDTAILRERLSAWP